MSGKIGRLEGSVSGTEVVLDMEVYPNSQVIPAKGRSTVNVFLDQTDAVVSISGDKTPLTGGDWHTITQSPAGFVSLPWPFSGLKIVKGASTVAYKILGNSV